MRHLFIINPISFLKEAKLNFFIKRIKKYFDSSGASYHMHISRFPRDEIYAIRSYMQNITGKETVRVYAVGGDGTAFSCLNGLVGLPNTELALLPYGASNDNVRNFGEGLFEEFRNIEYQVKSSTIPVDIIKCGTNYALNFCIVGIEAVAAKMVIDVYRDVKIKYPIVQKLLPIFFTWSCILSSFDRSIMNQQYTIIADEKDISGQYANIYIANGACRGGNKTPIIAAVPNDGILDMLLVQPHIPLKVVQTIIPYMKGRYDKYPDMYSLYQVKHVFIKSNNPLWINIDGESFFDSEIDIKIIPNAVKLVAVNNRIFPLRKTYNE
ncbi:MAG: hypothetical protein LBQ77_02650 [Treponema sp.]|jgi:diacylglycerol kinase family enzyme|nr:hypothetical protein [Treponema sp.]